jgi:plastocyanin
MRVTSARVFVAALALLAAVVGPLTALGPAQAVARAPVTWTVQVGSQTANKALQGMRFLPGDVTVDAGDTVRWVARSVEIHTVTFLPGGGPQATLPEFNPTDLTQLTQQGGSVYDPKLGYNSGLMTTVPTNGDVGPLPKVPHVRTYSLTFPTAGTFTYYCLVHGKMMVGVVHVQPAATPYPYTRAEYADQVRVARAGLAVIGRHLVRDLVRRSTAHRVFMGTDNGLVAVMRFVRGTVVVHRGESVVFRNPGMGAPHTVTFGREPPPPDVFGPSGTPAHYSGGKLNSGIIGPHGAFTVRFTKAGTYHYVCALHDNMGMRGTVVVRR